MNAVEFEHVSKSYSIYEAPGDRLKELLTFGRRSFHRDFRALRDLSFSIRRGEVFCIVGENGSGKSTTLQLIAGILQPSAGNVRVNGRVSALLELGAGFNPEFTGRDNVYLNGSILGLSKREIDRRYREIEDFAEIGDFIHQPVKTYSSGMVVRLAFAVAINVDPEILLVDEALAVGDTYFRHRCMRKVHELRARGVTIVFVSHAIADVQGHWRPRAVAGARRAMAIGEADAVLPQYLAAMTERGTSVGRGATAAAVQASSRSSIPNVDHRHGDGRAEILGIAILNEFGEPLHLMMPQSRIVVRISFRANRRSARSPLPGSCCAITSGSISPIPTRSAKATPPAAAAGRGLHRRFSPGYSGILSRRVFLLALGCRRIDAVCDWIDNAITVQMARGEGPVYGYIQLPCRSSCDSTRLESGSPGGLPEFTGERVIPGLVDPNLFNEHVARYRFAARFAAAAPRSSTPAAAPVTEPRNWRNAPSVVAIDISADAVRARARRFRAARRPLPAGQPAKRSRSPTRRSIWSSPSKSSSIWSTGRNCSPKRGASCGLRAFCSFPRPTKPSTPNRAPQAGPNPFHVHEFEYEEFRGALCAVFPHVRIWTQNHAEVDRRSRPRIRDGATLDAPGDPLPEQAHFFLAACSQSPIADNARLCVAAVEPAIFCANASITSRCWKPNSTERRIGCATCSRHMPRCSGRTKSCSRN